MKHTTAIRGPGFVLLAGLLLGATVMWAQPADKTIMDEVSVVPADENAARVTLGFLCPVQYLTHVPPYTGDELRIKLKTVQQCPGLEGAARTRGATPVASPELAHITEAVYEGDVPTGPFVTLRFSRQVIFEVLQGADFRSITVLVHPVP